MKLTLFLSLMIFLGVLCSFAQNIENESEYYPKTFFIMKVYSDSLGYRVDYRRQDYSVDSFWAPIQWFRGAANIGEITLGDKPEYPYISFFYKDGEIDHFRMYLRTNPQHDSWRALNPQKDYSQAFPSPDSKPIISFPSQ